MPTYTYRETRQLRSWRVRVNFFVFGQVESQELVTEAGDGEDGTMNCDTIYSTRVEGMRLIGVSVRTSTPEIKNQELTRVAWITHPSEHPYWTIRRCGALRVHAMEGD